jgi:hypothetical protein
MSDDLDLIDAPFDEEEAAIVVPDTRTMFRIPSGKYKGIELPRLIGVKPAYYDKVMGLKEAITADPEFQRYASTIARTYAELRREVDAKAAELSEIKLRLAAVMLLMIDQLEVEGETGMTLANGDKIRWQPEPHLVVTDKEAFRVWCQQNGLEREMTVPWGKANKLVKEMLVNGEVEPTGAECYMRPKIVFSRGDK